MKNHDRDIVPNYENCSGVLSLRSVEPSKDGTFLQFRNMKMARCAAINFKHVHASRGKPHSTFAGWPVAISSALASRVS